MTLNNSSYLRKYFPEAIGSHVIGRKWICDEDSRLSALGLWKWKKGAVSKPILRGSGLDDWLKDRPRSHDELNVLEALHDLVFNPEYYFEEEGKQYHVVFGDSLWKDRLGFGAYRVWDGVKVIAHWDDFHCYWNRVTRDKHIWQVEYKGLTSPEWIRFEAPAAVCQVKITQWVWEPVWNFLGWAAWDKVWSEYYFLGDSHFLERREDNWNAEEVEEGLDDAWRLYRGEREPIPPRSFKCRNCRLLDLCTIQNKMKDSNR